ncbi:MAG: glycosyltransferase family 4 protein [Gemmatimonadota bacterium]
MRLLLTTDTIGGVWDYSVTLAHALEQDGRALLLAVVGRPSDDQLGDLPEEIAIECRAHGLEWMRDGQRDLAATAGWLARLARGWNADVVHLNQMSYTGLQPFPAPTIVAVHSDVCSWFGEVHGTPAPAEWRPYVEAVRSGLRAATTVLTPSRYQADLVGRHFGRAPDVVIHNGCRPATSPHSAREGEPFLLSVGRAWDEAKGMAVYDEAVHLLGDRAPAAHLLGALQAPGGTRFEPTALSCHGRLSRTEVARWMDRASIYVGPSLYEPFGLAPLEAALHGCALVLSDIGSFRELWDGCAEFFSPGDARGLASAIEGLAGDPDRLSSLANGARERALTRYADRIFAERYLALYRRVATDGAVGETPAPARAVAGGAR